MTIFLISLLIFSTTSNAQIKQIDTIKDRQIVGKWTFVKTIDSAGNPVRYISKDYKDDEGNNIRVEANGSDITINSDYSYVKQFSPDHRDNGKWRLISNNEIEFEMVILKNSEQGLMLQQTEQLFGKKWKRDKSGNFLDSSIDKIVLLTDSEMHIQYEKKYFQVFKKSN